MAKSGTLTVKVLGDAKPFENTMSRVGKTAALAFAAVGTAAVAGAAKALTSFVDFQGQMNEVFTLLPGISQDAMDDMTGQVKGFAKEFGVLPDEVVPALYQSLSAGVPKDNVFEFLETAQKAAKGGVTDLTTAVDGISSVVNAYGSEVLNATQASDLMFTAVRLGKTNFSELSASLANVTPIASGLGVKFEDVSAALAAMTSKGTPTAQATTQLRSLFVELSKAGGKTAKVFEEMAGKTFQEFIAGGGNTAEALWLMQKAADESGVELQDLFGSVEAGAAALSLGSGDAFTKNIEAMGKSAGATEDAFDQMMTGLGPIFDKVKAGVAVFLIDVGERLAPVVERAMARAGVAFGIISDWWDRNGRKIISLAESLRDGLVRAFEGIVSATQFVIRNWDRFKVAVGAAVAIMVPHFVALGVAATVSAGKQVAAWVMAQAGAIKAAVVHSAQVALMVAKWAFVGVQSLLHAGKIAAAWLIAMGPIGLVIAAVAGVVALIVIHFDTIKKVIGTAWEAVKSVTSSAWSAIKNAVITGVAFVVDAYLNMAEKIVGAAATAFSWVPGIGDKLKQAKEAIARFRDDVNHYLAGIKDKTVNINFVQRGGTSVGGVAINAFHTGGKFHAPAGKREGLARLLDGERVLSPQETKAYERGMGGGTYTIEVYANNADDVVPALDFYMRTKTAGV